jgi:heat-inducible transcriptional repressor
MSRILLPERAGLLMRLLVDRYIRDGQPVGSKTLLEESGLPISSATIRNVLQDLEERGFLRAPHTSAGRIPTVQGFRFFVDSLLQVQLSAREPENMQNISPDVIRVIQNELNPDKSPQELIATASEMLADLTLQAGLVTVPRQDVLTFRMLEFLPLSDNRVLVILVSNEKDVQNRVIHTDRAFSENELRQAANYINQRFAGKSLEQVRHALVGAMEADRNIIDQQMQDVMNLAARSLQASDKKEQPYVLSGESRLLGSTDDVKKLRDLFDAFQQKSDILDLVDRCIRADGIQVFIGEEAGYHVLDDYSVITSPYQAGGRTLGVLGVIGPTRMAYERVIPMVDITARLLSLALSKSR